MKKFQRRVLSILLVLIVLAIPTLGVFAKENGLTLKISGPGIKGEVTLGNSDQLMRLEDSGFFGFSDNISFIKPLENPGKGYNITAYLGQDGKLIPFVEMVYYPAEEGQTGYVHYISKINGDGLKPVNEWGRLPLSADKAFRTLMTSNNIVLQPAILAAPAAVAAQPQTQLEVQPASPPAVSSRMEIPYITLAVTVAILAILGTGLVLRKRIISQRST